MRPGDLAAITTLGFSLRQCVGSDTRVFPRRNREYVHKGDVVLVLAMVPHPDFTCMDAPVLAPGGRLGWAMSNLLDQWEVS